MIIWPAVILIKLCIYLDLWSVSRDGGGHTANTHGYNLTLFHQHHPVLYRHDNTTQYYTDITTTMYTKNISLD